VSEEIKRYRMDTHGRPIEDEWGLWVSYTHHQDTLDAAREREKAAVADRDRLAGELKTWRDNAEYLLMTHSCAVRAREGGGEEDLIKSVVLTINKTTAEMMAALAREKRLREVYEAALYGNDCSTDCDLVIGLGPCNCWRAGIKAALSTPAAPEAGDQEPKIKWQRVGDRVWLSGKYPGKYRIVWRDDWWRINDTGQPFASVGEAKQAVERMEAQAEPPKTEREAGETWTCKCGAVCSRCYGGCTKCFRPWPSHARGGKGGVQ
jgi:hypothetical protein